MEPARLNWRAWGIAAIVVLAGLVGRVAYYKTTIAQPDEIITTAVVHQMQVSGDWDTNWAKADLPAEFKYDQYNFSSYLYAAFGFVSLTRALPGLAHWSGVLNGFWACRMFSILTATLVVGQTWWLGRKLGGGFAGVVAGLLAAVVPLLVQDAHYARPEPFVTALTLLVVALSLAPTTHRIRRTFVLGVWLGVLVACKVSMLLVAWLPLVPWLGERDAAAGRAGLGQWIWAGAVAGGGMVVGFGLGAPGAVLHPGIFWHGVEHLFVQYGGLQPPHSRIGGGPVAGMQSAYFVATLGWAAVVAAAGGTAVLAWRRAYPELLACAGPVVLFAGYFATKSVFFERNLSHVVPLFCVLAGVGATAVVEMAARRGPRLKPVMQLALPALLLLQPAQISARMVWGEFSGRHARLGQLYEAGLRGTQPKAVWGVVVPQVVGDESYAVLAKHFADGGPPVLLKVSDMQDAWSAGFAPELRRRFFATQVGVWPSTFADLPFCTLFTYVSPRSTYFLVTGVRPPPPGGP